jgi:serine/threonine protein kinase/Tfp pilus assembly protein PilF
MNNDIRQAQEILSLGLVPPDRIQQARSLLQPGEDLCSVLQKQGLLPDELVIQIRGHCANSQGSTSSLQEKKTQVCQLLASIQAEDLLFAPHFSQVFEPLEELGRGGMGIVYRVRDKRLGREAAMKIMQSSSDEIDTLLRFQREAQIMARLVHPAVPPVYETGMSLENEAYLLMRVVDGVTLKEKILAYHNGDKTTSLEDLFRVLETVAEAMSFVHDRGFLHRDLKPENIMVGPFGEVQIMDWGLARELDGREESGLARASMVFDKEEALKIGLTEAGTVLGTPGYMPPEQVLGEAVDARADVFALGAMLTEILTGDPPVVGPSAMDCLIATINGDISTPRNRDPGLPEELNEIAVESLQVDRDERTSSAGEFVEQLRWYREKAVPVRAGGFRTFVLLVSILVSVVALLLLLSVNQQPDQSTEREDKLSDKLNKAERRVQHLEKRRESKAESSGSDEFMKLIGGDYESGDVTGALQGYARKLRSARELVDVGDVCRKLGLLKSARELYQSATDRFPVASKALFRLHELDRRSGLFMIPSGDLLRLKNSAGVGPFKFAASAIFDISSNSLDSAFGSISRAIEAKPEESLFYYIRGYYHWKKMDYERAINDFDQAIDRDASYGPSYARRAYCYYKLGQFDKTIKDAGRGLELDYQSAISYALSGMAYYKLGNFERSRAMLERALLFTDRKLPLFLGNYHLGLLEMKAQRYTAAERSLKKALKCSPGSYEARVTLGQLYIDMKDYQKALDILEMVQMRSPNTPQLDFQLGRCYVASRQHSKANECLNRAIKLPGANESECLYQRSLNLRSMKKFDRAIKNLKRLLRKDQGFYKARFELARNYIHLNDKISAARELRTAINLNPKEAEPYIYLVDLYIAAGKNSRAQEICTLAIEANLRAPYFYVKSSILYREGHKFHVARGVLDNALRVSPLYARAHFEKARLLRQMAEVEEAYYCYLRALDLGCKDQVLYLELGDVAIELKKFQRAVNHFTEGLKKSSSRTLLCQRRAFAYSGLGKHWLSIKDLARVLSKEPENIEALYLRALSYRRLKKNGMALNDFKKVCYLAQGKSGFKKIYRSAKEFVAALEKR